MSLNTYDKDLKQKILVDGTDEVDSALSTTSTNPVQNKVITTEVQAAESRVTTLEGKAQNKVLYFTGVACAATTGNFTDYSNSAITADHAVAECVFANPAAITTDVTWTTSSGNVKLNGTCSSATTVNLVLVKKDN